MKRLRLFGFLAPFLAMSFLVLHTAHLDAGHANNSPAHSCVVCQAVSTGDAPEIVSFNPFFTLSHVIHSAQPPVVASAVSLPSNSRAPPAA